MNIFNVEKQKKGVRKEKEARRDEPPEMVDSDQEVSTQTLLREMMEEAQPAPAQKRRKSAIRAQQGEQPAQHQHAAAAQATPPDTPRRARGRPQRARQPFTQQTQTRPMPTAPAHPAPLVVKSEMIISADSPIPELWVTLGDDERKERFSLNALNRRHPRALGFLPKKVRSLWQTVIIDAAKASASGEAVPMLVLSHLLLGRYKRARGSAPPQWHTTATRLVMWLERDFAGLFDGLLDRPQRKGKGSSSTRGARVQAKAAQGLVSPAMRVLKSKLGLADPEDEAVFARIQAKHPPGQPVATPENLPAPLKTEQKKLRELIRRLPRGTAPGPSGLSADHIKAAVTAGTPLLGKVLDALGDFVDTYLAGGFNEQVAPFLNGARLIALIKPDGTERPIAIGEVLRRITARYAALSIKEVSSDHFLPEQVAIAVPGGAEAAIHSVTHLFKHHRLDPDYAILSIDGTNAYNTGDRANMLARVLETFPTLARLAYFLYGGPAVLFFGSRTLLSLCGTHQGCPLGGHFFCLGIHPMMREAAAGAELLVGYSDNILVCGKWDQLMHVYRLISEHGPGIGYLIGSAQLILSPAALAAIRPQDAAQAEPATPPSAMDIDEPVPDADKDKTGDAIATKFNALPRTTGGKLLGVPVGTDQFIVDSLVAKLKVLKELIADLGQLDPHTAFYLLLRSASSCRVTYLSRMLPLKDSLPFLQEFDSFVMDALRAITGTNELSERALVQAKLRLANAGLGLRSAVDHACAARISSISMSAHLVLRHLGRPSEDGNTFDATRLDDDAEDLVVLYNSSIRDQTKHLDAEDLAFGLTQEELSRTKDIQDANDFFDSASEQDKARLRSQADYSSYAFLLATPNKEEGNHIPDSEFGIALLYWIGDLRRWCGSPCAKCGAVLDPLGSHATGTCAHGMHLARHNALIKVLRAYLTDWNVPSSRETPHLFGSGDKRRPADIAIDSLLGPNLTAIDVTVVTPTCPSYVAGAALVTGDASTKKELKKYERYAGSCRLHDLDFIPITLESYGYTAPAGAHALKEIVKLALTSNREAIDSALKVQLRYLKQRLSVCLVRENANMILFCAGRRSADPNVIIDPFEPEELLRDAVSFVPDIANL